MTSPDHWLKLQRLVHFGDTDAAGVMHFHQLLRWCHEAWEESLERYGIATGSVFPGCRGQRQWPAAAPGGGGGSAAAPAAVGGFERGEYGKFWSLHTGGPEERRNGTKL